MLVRLLARIECERSTWGQRRSGRSYDRGHTITSRPGWIEVEIEDGALDPAARELLPILSLGGLQLWGQTLAGQRGELYVPVYHTGRDIPGPLRRRVARWANNVVEEYRVGTARRPALVSLTSRWREGYPGPWGKEIVL